MAKYKSLKGQPIQVLTADPPAPVEGQVWVVAAPGTASVMKGYALGTGAWASGGNTNTTDTERGGSAGTQTAGLIFGGGVSGADYAATNEGYNGTAWTELADLNTGRRGIKASVNSPQTAVIAFGGAVPGGVSNTVELWNGASWTEVAEINTATSSHGGCGISTAALKISGNSTANVESWDGSSWTEIANVNDGRQEIMATGTTTSAIGTGGAFPGGSPPNASMNSVEIWNGTSWTETTNLNTARKGQHGVGGSSGSDALAFGGDIQPGVTVNTELWNGSSWTELNNMATARAVISGAGTSVAAFGARGTPPVTNATEEWTIPLATVSFDID